jgi:hypothetical protein
LLFSPNSGYRTKSSLSQAVAQQADINAKANIPEGDATQYYVIPELPPINDPMPRTISDFDRESENHFISFVD